MTVQERPASAKYRLTSADYALLANAGAFGDQQTELLDGDVLLMSPQFRPHAMTKLMLLRAIDRALAAISSPLVAIPEVTLDLAEHDQPSPDIVLTSEPWGAGAVPLASVRLIVEVSVTTLEFDLGRKASLYAGGNVPEYWVADLNGRVVHQFWSPADGAYTERRIVPYGETLASAAVEGLLTETATL